MLKVYVAILHQIVLGRHDLLSHVKEDFRKQTIIV